REDDSEIHRSRAFFFLDSFRILAFLSEFFSLPPRYPVFLLPNLLRENLPKTRSCRAIFVGIQEGYGAYSPHSYCSFEVIPIFYKVSPTNVKRLKGEFGDNFRDREWEFESDEPKIKRWKEALAVVSRKFALILDENSSALEIEFVNNIVKEVLKMLQDIYTMERSCVSTR
ncbi:unnamed protein product, partial [Thlaspi arvense]